MFVVVMFQPAMEGENLSLTEQVNEVFGPFDTGDEAEAWTLKMDQAIQSRKWLVIPLSNTNVINKYDTEIN